MKRESLYIIGAILLIGVGILLLLQNLGLLAHAGSVIWAVLFGAGGLVFLGTFANNRQTNWWAIIPGFVLLAIGILIAFGDYLGAWGGALMVSAIGLAFLLIYLNNRQFWWAIIPAGVLLSVALMIGLSDLFPEEQMVAVMFLGMAATFLAIYFIPTPEGRMKWAIWPAAGCLLVGAIISLASASMLNWVWAAALIFGGAYLIYRTLKRTA